MKRKAISIILLFGLFFGLFMQYQFRAPKRNFCDYRVYYTAGKDILEGKNIYTREKEEITPFKYSPLFAVVMVPLSTFSPRVSASIFFIINIIAILLIFKFSKDLIFFKDLSPVKTSLILAIAFIMSFRFILHCLDSGQVGLLTLFLSVLGLSFITQGKKTRGALLIGLSVMIKYMPFLFVFYFFWKKEFKVVIVVLSSLILYCFLPAIFIGFKNNFFYLKEWLPYITTTSLDQGSFAYIKNYSLWSFTNRLFPNLGINGMILVTLLMFAVLLFFILKKPETPIETRLAGFYNCLDYGMILLCVVLFNPNAWPHNFVMMIFAYLLTVYYLFICNFKDKVVLVLVLASFILASLGSQSIVGDTLQSIFESYSTVTIGSLLLFVALIKLKFNRLAFIANEKGEKWDVSPR
jgi:hypothetical protein